MHSAIGTAVLLALTSGIVFKSADHRSLGEIWSGTCVYIYMCFHSENWAVVATLSSRTQDPQMLHLLGCLFLIEASFRSEQQAHYLLEG